LANLLEVKNLKTHFKSKKGLVKAVDGIDFSVREKEILSIVGESGCGKSVSSRTILGLIGHKKNEIVSGQVNFKGENLLEKSYNQMREIRGKKISTVFQDPMTSLNPLHKVGKQIAEVLIIHENMSKKEAGQRAVELLDTVGIPAAAQRAGQYPHQFSGGMRQRAIIAMALACKPDLLIADEPTTALDVTIQAQILDLLEEMREEMGTAIIMITHDLGVVAEVSDSVAVMYAGKLVEKAKVKELFAEPKHPYTKGLLKSIPRAGSREKLDPIIGQPPDLHSLKAGCNFADRCDYAFAKCRKESPAMKEIEADHLVSCWLYEEELEIEK
jgi:oligopeptide/dipeptide ABC transporter ATP-binding protein